MSIETIILLIGIVLVSTPLAAQQYPVKLQLKEGCSYTSGVNNMSELYGYAPSEDAQAIVDEILEFIGISNKNFRVMAGNVNNAMVTQEGRIKYIIYNDIFINKYRQGVEGKYAVYSVLAHELGHFFHVHDLGNRDPNERIEFELEADQYSGSVLRDLCATQEQALIAIRNLGSSVQDPLYPPFSAREQRIATSWYKRDLDIRNGKVVDPCGKTITLHYGERFKRSNLIQKAEGRIMGDKMIITYDMDNLRGENEYRPMIVTDPALNVSPRNIEWQSDPTQPGKGKRAIWHFGMDNYTKDQANQSQSLGLAAFKKGNVPKVRTAMEYTPGVAFLALGGFFFSRKGQLKIESAELYDGLYAQFRDENDVRYQGDNPSRDEVYTMANKKHRNAERANMLGYALSTVGAAYLIDRIIKDKRGRKASFHIGENGLGVRRTIGN